MTGYPTSVMVLEQQEVWVLDGINPPKLFGQGTFSYTGHVTVGDGAPADVFVQGKTLAAIESNVLGEISMELRFGGVTSEPLVFMPPVTATGESLAARLITTSTRYDYNKPANILDVSGTWAAPAVSGNYLARSVPLDSTLNVSTTGELSTPPQSSGCTVAGRLKPRLSGKNVFDLSVTLTGCADAGEYGGIAFKYIDTANYGYSFKVPCLRLIATNNAKTKVFTMTTTR